MGRLKSPAATGPTRASSAVGAIDVHAHFVPTAGVTAFASPEWVAHASDGESGGARLRIRGATRRMPRALIDLDEQLRDMDERSLDVRYLSQPPFTFLYDLPVDLARCWSRASNDAMIDALSPFNDRLRPVGILPMAHPRDAVDEIVRLARHGVALVEIGTHVLGSGLHEPAFRPVFRAAAEHGVALLVHPDGVEGRYADERWHLRNLVGNPFETAYTAVQLAASGVLDEIPELRVCLSHGGGALPQLTGRIDHAAELRPDVPLPPSRTWMPRFYYDSIVFSGSALDALVSAVGGARVCYGTDAPFDMSEPLPPTERFARFAEPDRRRMTRDTALDLLAGPTQTPTPLEEDA